MKALDRALLHDLLRLRAQVITLGLVIACGVGVFVALEETIAVVDSAREDYFRGQRLADVFVSLKRAPRSLLPEIALMPGVADAEGRVVGDVKVIVDGQREPAAVHLVSLDLGTVAPLNAVRIRQGRLPSSDRDDEVVLNEPFAEAVHLMPGAEVSAVVNGRLRRLRVVGVGISPEFVFQLPPGAISPNDARYGVAWMPRRTLEAALGMGGAFNDVALRLAPGADRAQVMADLDRQLVPFGGRDAYGREDQYSFRSLDARIKRMRVMLVFVPALFLLVAAFVLNVVLGRLVQTQREQIGMLKAFGYGDARLATHYLAFALLAVAPGAALGVAGGLELGRALIMVYVRYFRLPLERSELGWQAAAWALAVGFVSAALGALAAMRKVARLDPVEAMRAPAPALYRRTALSRFRLVRGLPAAVILILRNLRTAPVRFAASIAALAFTTALYVIGSFFGDSLDALVRYQFSRAMREDLAATFVNPVPTLACTSLRAVEGVAACEPLSVIPVRATVGPFRESVNLTVLAEAGTLRQVVDAEGRPVPVPPTGLLASQRLLDKLNVTRGDAVTIETLEGRPRSMTLPVASVVDDVMGLNLYGSAFTVGELTGAAPSMTVALLRFFPGRESEASHRIGGMPAVAGTTSRAEALTEFETMTASYIRVLTGILAVLAAALAVAVSYNGARVSLAERARDLASLRVLGFTRAEVTRILLGEMTIALVAGVPLGLILGHALAVRAAGAMASDEFRLPAVVTARTFLLAATVVVVASLASALHVRRLIDRLDLVEVLKTRE